MIKRKMGPNPNQKDQSGGKTKRQKLKQPGASKKQQAAAVAAAAAAAARKQQAPLGGEPSQARSLGLSLDQSDDSAWIYGMISNMQMLLQNDQRLKQAVRRQQLMGVASGGANSGNMLAGQVGRRATKPSGPRSRPSNSSSSGYSTPSSLYSAASLSPPFSSSSALAQCAYASSSSSNSPNSVMTQQSQSSCSSSSSSSPSTSKHLKAAPPETTKQQKSSSSGTNKSNTQKQQQQQQQQQQQILPRSPISRQIKFHEYKGPPQARRPSNQQKQQQQQQRLQQQQQAEPAGDTSNTAAGAFGGEHLGGSHKQIQRVQSANMLQTQPATQPTNTTLAPMTNHQIHCGRLTAANHQTVESLDRRVVKTVKVAPGGYALAGGPGNQPRQVSLQLIRSADGQPQQVLVLDPAAFEQMQQPQQDYGQQRGGGGSSIIVLQQTEPVASTSNYNTLLLNNSDDNIQFQAQLPAGMAIGRSFNVSESNQVRANFRAQLHRAEQQQVFPGEDLYYSPQQQPPQHLHQQPQIMQQRAAGLRSQSYEAQFEASCQMGPNPQQAHHEAPLGANYQAAHLVQQQQLDEMSPATSSRQLADQSCQLAQFYQGGGGQEAAYASGNGLGQSLYLDETLEDDTCEIEPTISFDSDLEHGMMMYSEFIDSQDIPLNVDESDWLKKFLPPCSSS